LDPQNRIAFSKKTVELQNLEISREKSQREIERPPPEIGAPVTELRCPE